ncbi:MAG: cytochrome c [Chloroflexi bacterium]|nr:cytochrome c [Chloroflexota bacterium]
MTQHIGWTVVMVLLGLGLLACTPAQGSRPLPTPAPTKPGGAPATGSPSGGSTAVAGDANNGKQLFTAKGCVACHSGPGINGGSVGPNLTGLGDPSKRPMLAANTLPNTPANVRRWVEDPQGVKPGTSMPNLGLTDKEAGDLVAFLYTSR